MAAKAIDLQNELKSWFQTAISQGRGYLDVRAGDLHQAATQKYGQGNRMPVCCGVMYSNIVCKHGDEILQLPSGAGGHGPTLVIRYILPRPGAVGIS